MVEINGLMEQCAECTNVRTPSIYIWKVNKFQVRILNHVEKKKCARHTFCLTPFDHNKYKISIKYKEYNIKFSPRIVEIFFEKIKKNNINETWVAGVLKCEWLCMLYVYLHYYVTTTTIWHKTYSEQWEWTSHSAFKRKCAKLPKLPKQIQLSHWETENGWWFSSTLYTRYYVVTAAERNMRTRRRQFQTQDLRFKDKRWRFTYTHVMHGKCTLYLASFVKARTWTHVNTTKDEIPLPKMNYRLTLQHYFLHCL